MLYRAEGIGQRRIDGLSGHHHAPKLRAKHLSVAPEELDALATTDPYKGVALDVATLKANPDLPGSYSVSGLVYDDATHIVNGRTAVHRGGAVARISTRRPR